MMTAPMASQFTQSLQLFVSPLSEIVMVLLGNQYLKSQTQSGIRYTPQLTRFYASVTPPELVPLILSALALLGVKCQGGEQSGKTWRTRVGCFDQRKEALKGWIEIEEFSIKGRQVSFCVLKRDKGNPISWRQLWKAIVMSREVEAHVLRKR